MQGKSKGQGLVEYAILLGLVTAAFMGMRLYVTRGLQARYKDGADYGFCAYWSRSTDKGHSNQQQDGAEGYALGRGLQTVVHIREANQPYTAEYIKQDSYDY